jgi:hypothetical protein
MILPTRSVPGVLRKIFWLAVPVLLLLVWVGTARGQPDLPWQAYWQLVDETDQTVSFAERSPAQAQALMKDLAERWENVTHVTLPGGELLVVNSGVLVDQLELLHPDWKELHALLAQMKASQSRASLAAFSEQDARAVQAILERPEYAWPDDSQQNPIQRFIANLLQKLLDFLNQLLPRGETTGGLGLYLFYTLGVFLILMLVLYFSLRGIFRELVQDANLEKASDGEEGLTATQAMQRAQDSAGAGDHRLAVRYLYLSLLLLLEERGLLRYNRSRTNREYLRSVQDHPQVALLLQDVIEVFDRVWYGYQAIDDSSYANYVEQVNRLKEQK